jgi:prevent-host-death family protein
MKARKPTTYNVHEAKTHLSRLIERVADGEEVIIARAGVPVARLVPLARPEHARPLGTEIGRIVIPDDFDEPLPPDVLGAFES